MKQLKSSGYTELRHDVCYPNPDYHNESFLFHPELSISDQYNNLLKPKYREKISSDPTKVNAVKALLKIKPYEKTHLPNAEEYLKEIHYHIKLILCDHETNQSSLKFNTDFCNAFIKYTESNNSLWQRVLKWLDNVFDTNYTDLNKLNNLNTVINILEGLEKGNSNADMCTIASQNIIVSRAFNLAWEFQTIDDSTNKHSAYIDLLFEKKYYYKAKHGSFFDMMKVRYCEDQLYVSITDCVITQVENLKSPNQIQSFKKNCLLALKIKENTQIINNFLTTKGLVTINDHVDYKNIVNILQHDITIDERNQLNKDYSSSIFDDNEQITTTMIGAE